MALPRTRRWISFAVLAVIPTFAACGGDSSGAPADDDAIGTLAYVQSSCEESGGEFRFSQSLRILHGEERTIVELEFPPVAGIGLCLEFGRNRNGQILLFVGALQRLGVSRDGETVVFEINDDFSATGKDSLAPEQEGIFSVRADGSRLRRIAPASRFANFAISSADPVYTFAPDGRIAFTDLGPGPDGEDAAQIFLLDLESGVRTQLTHLPRSTYVAGPTFLGDRVGFFASGLGDTPFYSVRLDGTDLEPIRLLSDLPGGVVLPSFQIVGERAPVGAEIPTLPPVNSTQFAAVQELFVSDGDNAVQITNFHRSDTARFGTSLSLDRERVFFMASVDLGENPTELCQLFSASVLGADIRQHTHFAQDHRSVHGCGAQVTDGCSVGLSFSGDSTDAHNGTIIFDSTCNAFGDTPYGEQLYAIGPDGTGLRQLTHTRGFIRGPERSNGTTELPGPWAYGPHL